MPFKLGRLPSNDTELYWYVRMRFGLTIPRTPVCPDHVPPFRAFADAYFARNSLDPTSPTQSMALWHGSRGLSGKSLMLSVLTVAEAETLGCDVNLLGGSLAQSMNIHEHVQGFIEDEEGPEGLIEDNTSTKITYTNGAKVRPLTASQKTVRGPHPPRLNLDEIDEMDLKILDAALGQPLPQRNYLHQIVNPFTVMCSTWQNAQGTFTEVKRRAEEQRIPVYQWCFLESNNPVDGWLSQEAIDEKRNTIPKVMWETEYELNEPSIGNRAFDTAAVDRMFGLQHLPDPEGELKGGYIRGRESKDYEEFVYANPLRGAEYVIAADWAREKDYTVIGVARVDVKPFTLVYYMRVNRRPYPVMVGYFNKAMERYHAQAIHDGTGLGTVIEDYVSLDAYAFKMVGEKRDSMLSEYVSAVEQNAWRVPRTPSSYIAHKYCQVGDLYSRGQNSFTQTTTATGAAKLHLPDEVCMMGLLNHLVRDRLVLTGGPPELTRSTAQTSLQKALDRPPMDEDALRRVGDVVRASEREPEYSLGV